MSLEVSKDTAEMASSADEPIKLQISDVSDIMDDDVGDESDKQNEKEEEDEDEEEDEEEEDEEDEDEEEDEEDEDEEDEEEGDVEVDDVELSGEDIEEDADEDDIEEVSLESSVPKKTSKKKIHQASSLSEMLQSVSSANSEDNQGLPETGDEEYSTEEDEDDDVSEDYLQKLKTTSREDYILNFHPEEKIHNYNEVEKLSKVVRDKNGNIKDPFHKTTPIMTRYEKTKVLGQRARQIDSGCKIFVKAPANTIDGYLIAQEELKQKKLPFIIRRPIPNGGIEYWPVRELDVIN
tara:strand:+ start:2294 stop:3172 length:879 start_codon:yes stop_codon:yes gene_type:complete